MTAEQDIVSRLRGSTGVVYERRWEGSDEIGRYVSTMVGDVGLLHDAAAEIERLRERVRSAEESWKQANARFVNLQGMNLELAARLGKFRSVTLTGGDDYANAVSVYVVEEDEWLTTPCTVYVKKEQDHVQ